MNYILIFISILLIVTAIILIYLYYKKHYMYIIQKEFYDDEHIKRIFYIRNGIVEGNDTIFYPTGEINRTQIWENGKLHGPFVVFFRNGNKYIEGNYVDGVYAGEYIVKDLDKNIILRKEF